jgi:hypothetical protein
MRHAMNSAQREFFRRTLQNLAESHAETLELLEQTFDLIGQELGIDAVTFLKARTGPPESAPSSRLLLLEPKRLQITYHGKACELSDTPFRLLQRLARRPNTYVTYEDLFNDVWKEQRSDDAIRSAIKRLRQSLRKHGLDDVAKAIDGSRPGRYRLNVEVLTSPSATELTHRRPPR